MTNEELVRLYQAGNDKALEELIENNKGVIINLVNKFYVSNTNSIDLEDLKQEGYIALINAANKYDFNKENKSPFLIYAIYNINWRIKTFLYRSNTNTELSLDKPIKEEEKTFLENVADIQNIIEDLENDIYIKELRAELEQAMRDNNTLYERELLKFRYGWDNCKRFTYEELGEIFNKPSDKVYNDEFRALKKLRCSTWGIEAEKEYFINKAKEIKEGSKFSQDKSIEVMNIMDKYLGDVV